MAKFTSEMFEEKSEGEGKKGKMPPQFLKHRKGGRGKSKGGKRGKERGRARMQMAALSQAAEENEVNG